MSVAGALLIDALMPAWDASIAADRIVRADPARTFQAARDLDFLSVHSPLLAVSMWVRGLPDRVSRRPSVAPPRLVLSAGDELPGWAVLGEQPGRELAFGAIGRFWQPSIEWHDVPAADFAAFAEPGWGKSWPTSPSCPTANTRACSRTNAAPRRPMPTRAHASCAIGGSFVRSSATSSVRRLQRSPPTRRATCPQRPSPVRFTIRVEQPTSIRCPHRLAESGWSREQHGALRFAHHGNCDAPRRQPRETAATVRGECQERTRMVA